MQYNRWEKAFEKVYRYTTYFYFAFITIFYFINLVLFYRGSVNTDFAWRMMLYSSLPTLYIFSLSLAVSTFFTGSLFIAMLRFQYYEFMRHRWRVFALLLFYLTFWASMVIFYLFSSAAGEFATIMNDSFHIQIGNKYAPNYLFGK